MASGSAGSPEDYSSDLDASWRTCVSETTSGSPQHNLVFPDSGLSETSFPATSSTCSLNSNNSNTSNNSTYPNTNNNSNTNTPIVVSPRTDHISDLVPVPAGYTLVGHLSSNGIPVINRIRNNNSVATGEGPQSQDASTSEAVGSEVRSGPTRVVGIDTPRIQTQQPSVFNFIWIECMIMIFYNLYLLRLKNYYMTLSIVWKIIDLDL